MISYGYEIIKNLNRTAVNFNSGLLFNLEGTVTKEGKVMYSKTEMFYEKYMAIYWANLSRFNNLMIILNISMFFLSGLVSRGYYSTFYSIGFCFLVAILAIIPLSFINRLWFYLVNLLMEFIGIYFLTSSIIYWVRNGAYASF